LVGAHGAGSFPTVLALDNRSERPPPAVDPNHHATFSFFEVLMIVINSYTTVKRRERVPHEVFAHYWRDVHGPLCARLPKLGLYIQHHFDREQDAHLWPRADGIAEIADYELDGGVEIGFASADDQQVFQHASPLLFSDEQNMFEETLAYDLPNGSQTVLNHSDDATHNGADRLDRIHLHLSPRHNLQDLHAYLAGPFQQMLAAAPGLMKLRLHRRAGDGGNRF
jgi:hypothetical protein